MLNSTEFFFRWYAFISHDRYSMFLFSFLHWMLQFFGFKVVFDGLLFYWFHLRINGH